MADLGMDFDHSQVEKGRDFEPIPDNWYLAQIKASDVVVPKSGRGRMMKLTFEILDSPYERRLVFDQINFQNDNPTAQLIGQQRLKDICESVGFAGTLRNTADIEFKPMRIKVGLSKPQAGYDQRNEIKAVKPASDNPPAGKSPPTASAAPPQQQPAQRPPPAAGSGTRPWGAQRTA